MNYKFSVVMAVYNVEQFVEASIQSLISQDIGFENIQLILVDDGSKDSSGQICDRYAEKYPDNIVVIHQENAGVARARNAGLECVQGRYVNFLDSDDLLSSNTLSEVYSFFEEHREETDIVSIPLNFFDAQTGAHMLNYKFDHGTRVIDLDVEWANPQLSLSSAFVKKELFDSLRFDPRLSYGEDAQLAQQILAGKCKLGVVATGNYLYRKRSSGEGSAIQTSVQKPNWYIPSMEYFHWKTIRFYLEKYHYLPFFVQYALMYDLQWRFQQASFPQNVLSQEEQDEYKKLLFDELQYIDDAVILAQKNIWQEQKLFILSKKYKQKPAHMIRDNDIVFCFSNEVSAKLSSVTCMLEFLKFHGDTCELEGYAPIFPVGYETVEFVLSVNGNLKTYPAVECRNPKFSLGEPILHYYNFRFDIPLKAEGNNVSIFLKVDGIEIPLYRFKYGGFFPLSGTYTSSYYCKNDWLVQASEGILSIRKIRKREQQRLERVFLKEVWAANYQGGRKAVLARCVLRALRRLKHRPLWLISDRVTKAGDNGEAFFRYMRAQHPEIDARFVLSKSSPDYAQMEKVGPVLDRDSFKHKLLSLMSDYIISSQAEIEVYNPFHGHSAAYQDILADTKFIFLQHGITKDDISGWLNRFNKNLYGFVTAAGPEYQSILNGKYFYSDKQAWLTGFPRFDRLYSNEQKQITIMPTWRKYLMGSWNRETDVWSLAPGVAHSEYLEFYNALLNNERLLQAAEKYGYHICFLPHPNFQAHLDLFKQNDAVRFLGNEVSYRDIYAVSELVITDYSSAVFDFAYLRKPVIYTHFDAETFFAGKHVYSKGYFDYERDGFGEVEYDLEGTVDRIIEYMSSGCKLKDKYRERIDNFFAFNDKNNCQRVYERILELEKETR